MRSQTIQRAGQARGNPNDVASAPPRRQALGDGFLSFAATPTFAVLALLAGIQEAGLAGPICSAMPGAPLLAGMLPMYLLMAVFHSAPWLQVIAGRRRSRGGA